MAEVASVKKDDDDKTAKDQLMAAVDGANKTKSKDKKEEKPQDIKKTVKAPSAPSVTVNNADGNAILITGATHARELLSM